MWARLPSHSQRQYAPPSQATSVSVTPLVFSKLFLCIEGSTAICCGANEVHSGRVKFATHRHNSSTGVGFDDATTLFGKNYIDAHIA